MLYETEIEMETDMKVKSENGYENGLKIDTMSCCVPFGLTDVARIIELCFVLV